MKTIIKALIEFQKQVATVKKTESNPFFKSSYADLASVDHEIRKPLTDLGMCYTQTCYHVEQIGYIGVKTTLYHESGEFIESNLELPLVKNDPQSAGSAITYARRYALMAIVGLCPEDDDGETAMERKPQESSYKSKETAYDRSDREARDLAKQSVSNYKSHETKSYNLKTQETTTQPVADWQDVCIHFGKADKDLGKRLGDCTRQKINWYFHEWAPKKMDDNGNFKGTEADKHLIDALEKAIKHFEEQDEKADMNQSIDDGDSIPF